MASNHYMYVLECGDGSLYCGYTNNLNRRLAMHQSGHGARYTRSHLPVKMIYHEEFSDKSLALKAEYRFKHQSRKQKLKYLRSHNIDFGE